MAIAKLAGAVALTLACLAAVHAFGSASAAAPVSAPSIAVTLLGTGSPIPLVERSGPSVLVEANGQKLLFDVGRGTAVRLWQAGVPLSAVTAVFFTHLHSDHVSGFPDLWLTGMLPSTAFAHRTGPVTAFGPAGTEAMARHLAEAYAADIGFREADEQVPAAAAEIAARDIGPGVVYEARGVRVSAFEVEHGEIVRPALGYRVDYDGHSIVLSGDTRASETLIRAAAGADVLFHEVAAARPALLERSEQARRIIAHHTTPEGAAAVFSRVKPRLAVYTHIVLLQTDPAVAAPTIAQVVAATRARYAGRVEVGEDLMRVEVGERVVVHRPHRRPHALP
jgi:ribonuclease Z